MITALIRYEQSTSVEEQALVDTAVRLLGATRQPVRGVWVLDTAFTVEQVSGYLVEQVASPDDLLVVEMNAQWASWLLDRAAEVWTRKSA